jgi:hypothetical protein
MSRKYVGQRISKEAATACFEGTASEFVWRA